MRAAPLPALARGPPQLTLLPSTQILRGSVTLGPKPRRSTAKRAWRAVSRLPDPVQPALERYALRLASTRGSACAGSALLEENEVAAENSSASPSWADKRTNNSYFTDAAGQGQPDLMAQPFTERERGFGDNGADLLAARLGRPDYDHGACPRHRPLHPPWCPLHCLAPLPQGSSRAWTASTSTPATRGS